MGNIYILVLSVPETETQVVGALGEYTFESGCYAYVGSARTTKFSRVNRHIDINNGDNQTRHWHIDYLLGETQASIEIVFELTGVEECAVAERLDMNGFGSLGASDCECKTHIFRSDSVDEAAHIVMEEFFD